MGLTTRSKLRGTTGFDTSTYEGDGFLTASAADITSWIAAGRARGASHLIIGLDPMDYENFPVYVARDQDVHVAERELRATGNRVDEVYWLDGDTDAQFKQNRSFTYGPE